MCFDSIKDKNYSFIVPSGKSVHTSVTTTGEAFCFSLNMASTLSLYLMCPVCLGDFTDPVSLPCEHVFCRQCIISYLESHEGAHKCPECRQNFTRQDLKGNRVLRNVVDVLQQQKHMKRQQTQEMLCSEHMEPLKLFCENDQRLVCLICKEGEKHGGHSFKPVKEAMEISEVVHYLLIKQIRCGS